MTSKAISADSHIIEPPEVFAGLQERFGDRAPRIVHEEGRGDFVFTPATAPRSLIAFAWLSSPSWPSGMMFPRTTSAPPGLGQKKARSGARFGHPPGSTPQPTL